MGGFEPYNRDNAERGVNADVNSCTDPRETYTGEAAPYHWHKDDFEPAMSGTVTEKHALSLYHPKLKKHRLRHPAVVAIISSILTSVLCFSLFAVSFSMMKPKENAQKTEQKPAGNALNVNEGTPDNGNTAIPAANTTGSSGALTIPQVYDKVSPTVVNIICTNKGSSSYLQDSSTSSGSGVIVTVDGYIVTNNHVVDTASIITVKTIAGQSFDAQVVGKDARSDLAVLKIESEQDLPFAELGDSARLRVGDVAIAIGNPLKESLSSTLTVGYISAINRTMVIDDRQMTMLQTDAAINPGNSGGALINIYGQVVGITTAKSTGYDVEGLGFAIPINEAIPVIESIMEHGYVTGRPLIGLTGIDVTEQIARANHLPIGVYVNSVVEGGAAALAGVRPGDVIVKFDGKEVKSIDEINVLRDEHKAGDVVEIEVSRNGEKQTYQVTLQEEKPSDQSAEQQAPIQIQPDSQFHNRGQFPADFFSWFER